MTLKELQEETKKEFDWNHSNRLEILGFVFYSMTKAFEAGKEEGLHFAYNTETQIHQAHKEARQALLAELVGEVENMLVSFPDFDEYKKILDEGNYDDMYEFAFKFAKTLFIALLKSKQEE